ncbi:MAG: hypothetical protein P1U40_06715 [Coxiellaceae bacterium]|nr:hypothetical protein [Coxiellaceae bacterium]
MRARDKFKPEGQQAWVIVAAEKYQSRKWQSVPQSKWDVVLRHIETGEEVHDIVAAQSVVVPGKGRGERYSGRNGGTAVVKDLIATPGRHKSLPGLVVKSFHELVWKGNASFTISVDALQQSAQYLRLQGYCSFVGEHQDVRRATKEGRKKPFVIMQKVGDGRDLFTLVQDEAANQKIFGSPQALLKFIMAFCRLMAVVQYFHEKEGRPILDIKAENIMPIRDKLGHIVKLVLIDLDNSFGNVTQLTPEVVTLADCRAVRRHWNRASDLSAVIDFHTLANVIAEAVNFAYHDEYFRVGYTDHPLLRNHELMKVSPRTKALHTPLVKLYDALISAVDGMSAKEIMTKALPAEHVGTFCEQFDAEMAGLHWRDAAMHRVMSAPAVVFPAFTSTSTSVSTASSGKHRSPALFATAAEQRLLAVDGGPAVVPLEVEMDEPPKKSCASSVCAAIGRVFGC